MKTWTDLQGKPATVGNGDTIALAMKTAGDVDAAHANALKPGASDEGAAAPRGSLFSA